MPSATTPPAPPGDRPPTAAERLAAVRRAGGPSPPTTTTTSMAGPDWLDALRKPDPTPPPAPPGVDLEEAGKPAPAGRPNRRKRVAAATEGNVRNATITADTAFAGMFARASSLTSGRRIVTSREAEAAICGIPLPALSARWIFQQTVLPLSRQIMIYGDFGSCKSALLAEMYRWFLLNSGLCWHIDNENKDGPDLRHSLLYRDPRHQDLIAVEDSDCQQDWMEAVIRCKDAYDGQLARTSEGRRDVKKKDGETAADFKLRVAPKVHKDRPGYIYPLIIGLDSLTGTASASTIQGIEDDGSPKNRFQEEAKFLSDFAKSLPRFFRKRPAVLVTVNHRKDQVDKRTGLVSDRVPGGSAMRYMDSTEIKTEKIGKIETVDFGGIRVAISNPKNSLGPTGGRVVVDFKWWYEADPDTGLGVQRSAWDWDAATVDLLLDYGKKYTGRRDAIKDVVDLNAAPGRRVWSNALGIPAAKPVGYSEAGRMLEADGARMAQLHDILHIKSRTVFVPGVEYGKVRDHLLAAAQRLESVYARQAAVDLTGTAFIDDEIDQAIAAEAKKKAARRPRPADEEDSEAA